MTVILIVLAGLLPLSLAPGLFFHYDVTPKTLLLCAALAAALLRVRSVPAELEALWRRENGRLLISLALSTIIWFGISAAFSSRAELSLTGSSWREFGAAEICALLLMAILTAAHLCARPERISALLRTAVVAGFIVSLYGIAQYFDLDPFQSASGYHAPDGDFITVRPPGTFGHADYFGWWLAIDFFCALAVRKRFATVTAGLIVIATVLTGTRSAVVALAVGCIALMIVNRLGFRRGRSL